MLFEYRHAQHDSVILEMRHAPFHCLLHLGTSLMNKLPNMPQERPRERRRLSDVSIYSRISTGRAAMLKFLPRWRRCNLSPTRKFSLAQSQLEQFGRRRFP